MLKTHGASSKKGNSMGLAVLLAKNQRIMQIRWVS